MTNKMKILPITEDLYIAYYKLVVNTQWGNPILPSTYSSSLWGCVIIDEYEVVGGWVGMIKGDTPIVGILTKSVYFDSYPIFVSNEVKNQFQEWLLRFTREYAKKDGVIMLHLTHWIRENDLSLDSIEPNATFATSLHLTKEELFIMY